MENCDSVCIADEFLYRDKYLISIDSILDIKKRTICSFETSPTGRVLVAQTELTADQIFDKYEDHLTKEHVKTLFKGNG